MSNVTFTNSSYNGVSGTLSWSHNLGTSDDFIVVGVSLENDGSDSVDGMTVAGTSMTLAKQKTGGDLDVALFYMLDTALPSPGTVTLVCSTSEAGTGVIANAISGYNLTQAAPEVTASTSVTSADTITSSFTTVTSDAIIFDAVAGNFMGADWTVGTSQTAELTLDNRSGFSYGMSTREEAQAGGNSMTWTASAGVMPDMSHVVAAFASTGAGGGGGGGVSSVSGEITYDSDGETGGANVTTLSISSIGVPSESDLLLVCHVGLEDKGGTGLTVNSIGFGGTGGTLAVSDTETTGDDIKALIYYWLDADLPSSNGAFGLAMSAEVRTISMNWTFVYGAAQQAPEATGTANAASSTTVNPSLTTSTDGAFVFSNVVALAGATGLSPGASQTERFEYSGASTHAGGDKEVATAGSTNNTWDSTASDNLVAVAAAFAPEVTITEVLDNYYLTGARTAAGDASGDEATFTFTLPREALKVDVFAWWPTGNYATDTPFTLTGQGTGNTITIDVDQSVRGGQRNYIGGLSGRIGAGEFTVVIDDDANGAVVADAVWIEATYAVPPRSDIPIYDGVYPERHYSRRLVD